MLFVCSILKPYSLCCSVLLSVYASALLAVYLRSSPCNMEHAMLVTIESECSQRHVPICKPAFVLVITWQSYSNACCLNMVPCLLPTTTTTTTTATTTLVGSLLLPCKCHMLLLIFYQCFSSAVPFGYLLHKF
ncbi:hypothetical protein AMTRI_Chr04g244230 [Amborella trichopoda]